MELIIQSIYKISYMYKIWLILLPLLLKSCSSESYNNPQLSNEIDVSLGIRNAKEKIMLSEFIDSITFIPLETKPNNLFYRVSSVKLTPDYIHNNNNNCFQWDGKFFGTIGKRGQGPCEEPGHGIGAALLINGHFYTKGSKLIEYDRNGNCTGNNSPLKT